MLNAKIESWIRRFNGTRQVIATMSAIRNWFKKTGSIGEPVPGAITVEDLERELITLLRRDLCDRWWRSLNCRNDGTQSEVEFQWSIMREKRNWWRWKFGEEMPQ